jgi:drug/metabolite transporter (DMT)-like permease
MDAATSRAPAMVKESDALLASPATAPAPAATRRKQRPGTDGIDLCFGRVHLPAILVISLVVFTYGSLSVGFNLYNSFLLRIVPGFKFPVVYTTTHMIAGSIGASTLIFGPCKAGTVSWAKFAAKWKQLLLLACFRSGTIVLNNWSLVLIDLTLNKVIKSSVPVFVVIFSILVEKKKYSWQVIATLSVLSMGTVLSCVHTSGTGNNPIGIVMAVGSAMVGGAGIVMSALLLGKESGLSPVELLFYFSPLQTILLGILMLFTEFGDFIEWAGSNSLSATGFIFLGAGLAFLFNLTGFCLVQTTSATTTAICGNVVVVIVIVLGSIYLHVDATPLNIIGYCISVIAAIIYVAINLHQKKVCAPKDPGASATASVAPAK